MKESKKQTFIEAEAIVVRLENDSIITSSGKTGWDAVVDFGDEDEVIG